MRLFTQIYSDLARYKETFALRKDKASFLRICLESFIFKPGFQAVFLYRMAHFLFSSGFNRTAWFVTRCNQFLTSAEIEYNAKIGNSFFIAHPAGVVIGRGSIIGEHFTIFQGATLGTRNWKEINFPIIKDNVIVFSGARILGEIVVCDHVIIGANAVVTKDVKENMIVFGYNESKKK